MLEQQSHMNQQSQYPRYGGRRRRYEDDEEHDEEEFPMGAAGAPPPPRKRQRQDDFERAMPPVAEPIRQRGDRRLNADTGRGNLVTNPGHEPLPSVDLHPVQLSESGVADLDTVRRTIDAMAHHQEKIWGLRR